MDSDGQDLPQFESLSPSGRYAELTDYCVDQLLGWLDELLDGDGLALAERPLLDRLQGARRGLRNGYRLQLHKLFSDFKAIQPLRRSTQVQPRWQHTAQIDSRVQRLQSQIQSIEDRILTPLEPRLQVLDRRMKYLVHRSDDGLEDNPLRPGNLCVALLSGLEGLDIGQQRSAELIECHADELEQRLPGFCRNLDWVLSELGVCFDLPFEEYPQPLAVQGETPEVDTETEEDEKEEASLGAEADRPAESEAHPPAREDTAGDDAEASGDETATIEATGDAHITHDGAGSAPTDHEVIDSDARNSDEPEVTQAESLGPVPEEEFTDQPDITPAAEPATGAAQSGDGDDPEPTLTATHPDFQRPLDADATEYALPGGDRLTTVPSATTRPRDLSEEAANDPQEPTSEAQGEGTHSGVPAPRSTAKRINSEMRRIIDALKQQCESPEAATDTFRACVEQLCAQVDDKRRDDLEKFAHFHSGLITNPHVCDPLRQQLLRLSAPLLYLVLSDPFFFRSSAHPVNDFLHSLIDFEIRHGHEPRNLKVLTLLIDNLLQLEVPVLSDFQPITQGYEVFKRLELERLQAEKKPLSVPQNGSRNSCSNGSTN